MKLSFEVNGRAASLDVPPMKRLVDVLRDDLRLTETNGSCTDDTCSGACLVLMDDDLVPSCLVPAVQLENASIVTVEALAKQDALAPLRKALAASSCPACTSRASGILVAGHAFTQPDMRVPGEDARTALAIPCDCAGYDALVAAMTEVLTPRPAKKKAKRAATRKTAKRAAARAPRRVARKASKKKPAKKKVAPRKTAAKKKVARKTTPKKKVAKKGARR